MSNKALEDAKKALDAQALKDSQKEWMTIFDDGPYTGLKMIEYIMTEGNKTPEEFLKNPKTLIPVISNIISNQTIDKMKITWANKTGRCTSFAVKVVHNLAEKKIGNKLVYDWCIYNLGHHRIARCRNTGVVIDSNSTTVGGALCVPEGKWLRVEKTDASWK